MAYGILSESSVFLTKEVTEGTYVAPASANDALEVLTDGYQFNYTRELVEVNTLSGSIESDAPRVGIPNVEGSLATYYRASSTAGSTPPNGLLFESMLGGKRQITTTVTTKTGNSSTVLQIQDADIAKFVKGDIILVKEAGQYEARPVSAVDSTLGAANITLAFALEGGAPADNVVIEKSTVYYAKDGAPTLSLTEYLGGEIEDKIYGLRAVSGALQAWETGQVASWNFSLAGAKFDKAVGTPSFTPDFSGYAAAPVMLNACVWIDGVKVPYTSLALNVENTKVDLLSVCSAQGKIGSRFNKLVVTADIVPYMEMDDVDRFNKFNLNQSVSVFGYAYNETAVAGEKKEIVAFYLPQAKITELPASNVDLVLTENMKLQAHKAAGEDTIFLGFI
jgi:hypothetical protein